MIILWLSRHDPLPAQIAELQRLFHGCDIRRDSKPFGDGADILRRAQAMGAAETVVVAPLSVIDSLCRAGMRPLRAEMVPVDRLTDPTREVFAAGRVYRFVEFRRIIKLELVTEPIVGPVEEPHGNRS